MSRVVRPQTKPTRNDIAVLAYCMWQNEGCKPGHDQDYWLAAEQQLRNASHSVLRERSIEKPINRPAGGM
jgi:hypothetical protein